MYLLNVCIGWTAAVLISCCYLSGVTILLAITIFSTIVGDMLPITDSTPLIGKCCHTTKQNRSLEIATAHQHKAVTVIVMRDWLAELETKVCEDFTIMEKAPTTQEHSPFLWLKAPTRDTIKTHTMLNRGA